MPTQSKPPTTMSKTRLIDMLKRLSSTWATSSSGMPSTSSTTARELTTSKRRGTIFTRTPESAQARTTRRKSLWRALEKATMTRSTRSSKTILWRSPRAPMIGTCTPPLPLRRGSPSSRKPTSCMRYSACLPIFAATVCPTSPAPMISTRSWNAACDHTVALPSQRAAGTRTTASIQKAMSAPTGACGPATKTIAISISQLAEVSAVSPLSDSERFMPPMLRPGSRYRPKAHRAASQKGVRRMNVKVPPCGSDSKGMVSLLITGTSSNAPATQTASSEAATMATMSALNVAATRSLEGRILPLPTMAGLGSRPAWAEPCPLIVSLSTRAVSTTLEVSKMGRSSGFSPM